MLRPQPSSLLAIILFSLVLVACGGGGGNSSNQQDQSEDSPTEDPPENVPPPEELPDVPAPPPAPANVNLVPLSDYGETYSVEGTKLGLGPGVGFKVRDGSVMTRALAVDSTGNRYAVDLTSGIQPLARSSGLRSFVEGTKGLGSVTDESYWTSPPTSSLGTETSQRIRTGSRDWQDREDRTSATYRWSLGAEGSQQSALDLSINRSGSTTTGLSSALASRQGAFFASGAFLTPYENLYDTLSGAAFSFVPAENATVSLSGFLPSEQSDEARASLQKAELKYKTLADVELRLGYGWMHEKDAWLGSQTSGAFGQGIEGSSEFATASILAPLTDKLSLFGAYTYGTSSASGSSGLISDWSKTHANAFGIGLLSDDVVAEGDHLSLMIGQPHRVSDGKATLVVPTAIDDDGRVVTETETVDLSPDGREISIESTYRFSLGEKLGELATGAFLRLEPDHDPDAEPDIGVGLRYQKEF